MKKVLIFILSAIMVLGVFALIGCDGKETYSITYDVQGGVLGDGAINSYSESDFDIALPVPTKDGHDFIGWKENDDADPINSIVAGTTGNKNFIAVWRPRFIVYLDNTSAAKFTAWADQTTGTKTVEVSVGGTIVFPTIKYDNMSQQLKDDLDYYLVGWFYKDKDNVERELTEETLFTLEALNIDDMAVEVYVQVERLNSGWY